MRVLSVFTSVLLLGTAAHAADKYWDINGATAGAGGATPSGSWDTTAANWSTSSAGTAATAAWSGTTDKAVFSAGTDATGEFTVDLPSARTAGSVTNEEGTVVLTGSALTSQSINILSGATLSYSASGGVTGASGATMYLNGGRFKCTTAGNAGTFLTTNMKIVLGSAGGILNYDNPSAPGNLSIYGGVISGTGGLTKDGTAVLALTGTSTYSGSTTINDGTLRIRTTSNRLPTGTALIINSPGVFDPGSTSGNVQQVATVTGNGSITFSASSWLRIAGSGNSTFSGVISDGSVFGRVYKQGNGTLTLSGVNTYDGRIDVSAGTVTVPTGGSLIGAGGDVYLSSTGVINLNNGAQTIENLSGTGGTLNLNATTLTSEPGFNSDFSGSIAGTGAYVYNGAPVGIPYTCSLGGSNSYSGGTTINGGILVLSGTNYSSGAIAVNAGTLRGVVGGSYPNSVVTLQTSASNVVQVLDNTAQWACGGISFGGGSYLHFDFGFTTAPSTTVAPLMVNGNVDFTANPAVSLNLYNLPTGPGNYPLMTWTGNSIGTFAPVSYYLWPQTTANLSVSGKTLYLVVSANAEPLTWRLPTSGTWDINTTASWLNALSSVTNYLETSQPGDQVVFNDSPGGTAPVTVTLDSTVVPGSVVASNSVKDYTISGFGGIAGPGFLTKTGSGKLTLNTANAYTGGTTIQQGTLQLGDGTSSGSVAGNIANAGSLIVSNAADVSLPGDISGAGTFTKGGAGILTIGAGTGTTMSSGQTVLDGTLALNNTANMMSGPVLVDGPNSILKIASSGCIGSTAAGSGDITLNNGATFENDNVAVGNTFLSANRKIIVGVNGARIAVVGGTTGTQVLLCTGTILGATPGLGTLTFDGPGELRYSGTAAHNTFGKLILNSGRFCAGQSVTPGYDDTYGAVPATFTADAITIRNGAQMRWGGGGTATLSANRGITLGAGGGTIHAVSGAALTIPGIISGSGPLQLNMTFDTGIISLNGANTFTGGLTLLNGDIRVANAQAFGPAANPVYIGGLAGYSAILRNSMPAALTLANNPHTWVTDFTFAGTNNLNIGAGPVTLAPASGSVINVTNTSSSLIVGGVISGTGMGLTKQGSATLQLNAANTYSGGTTIAGGTLQLGDGSTVNGSVAGDIVDNATLLFANPNPLSYSGVISGTGAVTKQAPGVLTLSGANTYSGVTTISSGTITLGANDVIPAASQLAIATNAFLDMNGNNDTVASLNGLGNVINNTGTLTVGGDATTGSAYQTYSCVNCIITNGTLAKAGTHTMALRETNALTIPVTLTAGTLSVGVIPNQLPTTSTLSIPLGATFQLDAINQTLAALDGAGNVNLGGGTLTVNQAADTTFSGLIQESDLAGSSTAVGHGLRGYYYDNIDFSNLLAVRDDATVNFSDLTSSSQLPAALFASSTNDLSIRWLGQVQSTLAGTYTFTTVTDDGARLWVNGTLLVDSWIPQSPTARSGTVTLAANTRYDIVFEFFNRGGGSSAKLQWTPPGDTTSGVIPTENLLLPGAGKLVKNGNGVLTLSGANTYSGGTVINGGTVDAVGALGSGDVTVASGATLKLSSGTAMAATADLLLNGASPVVNLNLSGGTMSVHALSFDGGATYQSTGTYGPVGSGAPIENSRFTGSGFVSVGVGPVSSHILATSASPAVYGSSITFTSTLTGSSGTPTGTVTFFDGASALGTATLDGSGVAALAVNKLSVSGSPHAITAVYNGGNYARNTSTAVSQTVTPAPVSAVVGVASKVYDGTTAAAITNRALSGVIAGDAPFIGLDTNAVAVFFDRNVGTLKVVNVSGLALVGSLISNYSLASSTLSTNADIAQRPITVTAVTSTKTYDGTTNSTGVPTITTGTLATGDTAAFVEYFDSPEVGTRTLRPAGSVNDGNSGLNYLVTLANASGTITPVCSSANSIMSIVANTNKTLTLTFQGTSHAQYYVMSQTNIAQPMTAWSPVAGSTNVATNTSGIWSLTVSNAGSAVFYRSGATTVCP